MASNVWKRSYPTGAASRRGTEQDGELPSVMWQWEYGWMSPGRRALTVMWKVARRPLPGVLVALAAFAAGVLLEIGPNSTAANWELRHQLATTQGELRAREGELQLVRLELGRVNSVMTNSARYRIPADLAAEIYDIALSEGINPDVAFRLVSVESEFTRTAVSRKGAIGLTQVMPATARQLNPRLKREDLFHRETNLRLGFSYLRYLIQAYGGDLRLALLAYNRGPAVVNAIRRQGGDPENGYARAVLAGLNRPKR